MPNSAYALSDVDPASLQYLGLPGLSSSCLRSIRALIQLGRPIGYALIITCGREHAFLFGLGHDSDELLIVKAGFTSGYPGEGPRTFAEALELLQAFDIDIEPPTWSAPGEQVFGVVIS